MILAEYIIEAARFVTVVYEGSIDSVSGTTIVDNDCYERVDTFKDGTFILTTGSAKGEIYDIVQYSAGTFEISGSSSGIAVGDKYAAIYPDFPRYMLEQACRNVIRDMLVPATSENETISNGVCKLSNGVSNVKMVIIGNVVNYHWDEINGYLYFDDKSLNGAAKVIYVRHPNEVNNPKDEVSPYIDLNYVGWATAMNLWRTKIQNIMKDNPTAVEMLNEAKANYENARSRATYYAPSLTNRTARLSKY